MKRMGLAGLAALALAGLSLAGCQGGDTAPKVSVDDQVKAIESNSHMPQQAKDLAIANIKAHQQPGAGQAPR